MRTLAFASLAAACCIAASGCKRTPSPDVAATVNGRPITYAQIEKQFQMQFSDSDQPPADDQMTLQKIEILRTLIDSEIMLQRAEKLGLMATESDVEAKFNELKAPYTQEEFQKQLDTRKMTVDDLKAQIRRELSVTKLINKDITSKISISDADVTNFYEKNKDSFNLPEPKVHLAQIVVTPAFDENVRNLKNDDARTEQAARDKIQTLSARLRRGEEFSQLAQNYSEDPSSAGNGGDLGFIGESSLEKADPQLRRLITELQPGQTSPVIRMPGDFRILKVISREPAGQRQLNDPRVQQSIRETLLNRKDQLLRVAYYEVARNEAKVVNHFAAKISENKGQP